MCAAPKPQIAFKPPPHGVELSACGDGRADEGDTHKYSTVHFRMVQKRTKYVYIRGQKKDNRRRQVGAQLKRASSEECRFCNVQVQVDLRTVAVRNS